MKRILPLALIPLPLRPRLSGEEPPRPAGPNPAAHRGFLLTEGRLYRGRRQGIGRCQVHGPRPSLSFTSAPIAKALVDAHKRGVKVEVILDKSQKGEKYTSADFVIHAGIPIED